MIKPGLVSATFKQKTDDEVLRLCVANGLRCIEWSEDVHVLKDNPSQARLLREKTERAGVGIAAYGSYYRIGANEDAKSSFKKTLASAFALGAPVIRVWAGTSPSAEVGTEEFSRIARESSTIADMAAEKGIKVAFEWHKNTLTDTNESAIKLLDRAGNPNLYCLWQPTVALGESERCEGLRLLGRRLVNFHVYHWTDGKRRPLGEGENSWRDYFGASDKSADHCALLEFVMGDSEQQFAEDASALHSWIAKYC